MGGESFQAIRRAKERMSTAARASKVAHDDEAAKKNAEMRPKIASLKKFLIAEIRNFKKHIGLKPKQEIPKNIDVIKWQGFRIFSFACFPAVQSEARGIALRSFRGPYRQTVAQASSDVSLLANVQTLSGHEAAYRKAHEMC